MANKKCLLYETLNNVQSMYVNESIENNKKVIRLSGVFGVCGVKNNNNRVYNKQNYGMMVEALQQQILTEGCPGELEHPNSMNITLENVSHKIESIQMNEDGTITGTIRLLDTPKGKIAQSIVEGGLPLYISSRGAGSIDNNGNVTLSMIKTYDLVGTPGFSQAKLTLAEGQTLECLNESAGTGSLWAIVEDEVADDKTPNVEKSDSEDSKKDDSTDKEEIKKSDDATEDKDQDTEKNNDKKVDMTDLKTAIDKLSERINNLEAELHIAKESLVNYDAIEKWVVEEFGNDFKKDILNHVDNTISESTKQIANGVQSWVCEEFAPEVQNWVCEEFAPEVQNWVCEEFAPEVQNWVCEEFAPEVQNWVCEEFAPDMERKINENIDEFVESQKDNKLNSIDKLLESIDSVDDHKVSQVLNEQQNSKFAGVYVVEHMPNEYRPSWELLDESRQDEIIRSSRMYDFTKDGVLESFWATSMNSELNNTKPIQDINESLSYADVIANKMKALR